MDPTPLLAVAVSVAWPSCQLVSFRGARLLEIEQCSLRRVR